VSAKMSHETLMTRGEDTGQKCDINDSLSVKNSVT
jgi:hypothetical protein